MPNSPFSYDLHTHTIFSDGRNSIEEMLQHAQLLNLTIGISDHVDTTYYMKSDHEIELYYSKLSGMQVLKSIEMSTEPTLQISRELLQKFDYLIASAHSIEGQWIFESNFLYSSIDRLINSLLQEIEAYLKLYPFDILGHPTLLPFCLRDQAATIWKDEYMETLIDIALEYNVALEINTRNMVPHEQFVALAYEKGARFSIGSDAHRSQGVGKLSYAHDLIRTLNIPESNLFIPVSKEHPLSLEMKV